MTALNLVGDVVLTTEVQREEYDNARELVEKDLGGDVGEDEIIEHLCRAYTGRL